MKKIKNTIIIVSVLFSLILSGWNRVGAEEPQDVVPITANMSDWSKVEDIKNEEPVVATNLVVINEQEYKLESMVYKEDQNLCLNERNQITNLSSNEVISYTPLDKQKSTSKLLYSTDKATTYNELLVDENTEVLYKIDTEDNKQILRKMYRKTKLGVDVTVSTTINSDGKLVHTIDVSNSSDTTIQGLSFLTEIDILINGNANIQNYADGDKGLYLSSGHVNVFAKQGDNIKETYIGEKGIIDSNDLNNQGFLVTGADAGTKGSEFDNTAIYYRTIENDLQPGGVMTFTYEEKIYVGELDNTVVVRYVSDDDKTLSDIKMLSGEFGDSYTTHQMEFEGYEFIEIKGNKKGIFLENEQDVIYYYKRLNKEEVMDTADFTDIHVYIISILSALVMVSVIHYKRKRV